MTPNRDPKDTRPDLTRVPLPAPAADGRNDNARPVVVADTTAFAAHAAFVHAVKATLVRRGRGGQELESHLAEVQTRTIEAARSGPMPRDLGEWTALGTTIARRYARDERKKARVRDLYDAGLCEDPDAHGPLERATRRDPVDTKRYLAVLGQLFEQGKMPEMGGEILWGVAEELTHPEIAEETGLTERQVQYRMEKMRRVFRARITDLGMVDDDHPHPQIDRRVGVKSRG